MGKKRNHRKSWDNPWDCHFLTFSTFGRQPFFSGRWAAGWYLQVIEEARSKAGFHLFAWVIMPEHVHLILQPKPSVKMRSILWRLKRPMTQRVLAWVRQNSPEFLRRMEDRQPSGEVSYRFWLRGGGYDRNLRSASDVHEKIRYIHENPVRRGLVERPEEYAHSSAPDWILGRPGPITIDWDLVPDPETK